ncbi:Rpn family recombination-promoting nuclease/putative transposase [Schinkia sp. CFF1]
MKTGKPATRNDCFRKTTLYLNSCLAVTTNVPLNIELLTHFLNDLFQVPEGQSFPDVHLLNPQLNKEHLSDKASILDIKAQIPGAGMFNIEMQLENQYNMDKRTLFYSAKMIAAQLNESDNYKKLRKTTTINLLDFDYSSNEHYHSIYHLTEKQTGIPYPDILQLHFIEMKKFKRLLQTGKVALNDCLAKWIEFISNEDDNQYEVMAFKDSIIKKAVNQLEIISQNPENRWEYEIRQKALKDITTMKEGAREEGEVEGITKGKIDVALKMLCEGLDLEFISKFTGFTRDELLKLQKDMKLD